MRGDEGSGNLRSLLLFSWGELYFRHIHQTLKYCEQVCLVDRTEGEVMNIPDTCLSLGRVRCSPPPIVVAF